MYMYNVNFTFFDIVHVHFLIEKCTCTTWQLFYTKAFGTCVTNSALFFFHTVAYECSKTGKEWIFLSILQTLCLHTEVRYLGYKYGLLRHRSLQRSTAHRFWFSWLQIVHHINNGIIFPSLNNAKIFEPILDEPWSTSSWMSKLNAQ